MICGGGELFARTMNKKSEMKKKTNIGTTGQADFWPLEDCFLAVMVSSKIALDHGLTHH